MFDFYFAQEWMVKSGMHVNAVKENLMTPFITKALIAEAIAIIVLTCILKSDKAKTSIRKFVKFLTKGGRGIAILTITCITVIAGIAMQTHGVEGFWHFARICGFAVFIGAIFGAGNSTHIIIPSKF